MSEAPGAFDPASMLSALAEAQVDYVLIGGLAAVLQGAAQATVDVDVLVRSSKANLERLVKALRQLDALALMRVGDEVEPVGKPSVGVLRSLGDRVGWSTRHGYLDTHTAVAGVDSFDQIAGHAWEADLATVVVPVATVTDLIRMKEAVLRDKDRAQLADLYQLREFGVEHGKPDSSGRSPN